MHRQFSLQPFSRHYSHSTNPFLDLLEIDEPAEGSTAPPSITVIPSKRDNLLEVLKTHKSVQKAGTMLTLTFVTVNDYLWLLRAVSQELSVLGKDAMYYLAAAVSDFFLPKQKMVFAFLSVCLARLTLAQSVHKIQSGKGSLHIEMDQVPKILKPMVAEWTRQGFVVSFKVYVPHEIATSMAESLSDFSWRRMTDCSSPRLKPPWRDTVTALSSPTNFTEESSRSRLFIGHTQQIPPLPSLGSHGYALIWRRTQKKK